MPYRPNRIPSFLLAILVMMTAGRVVSWGQTVDPRPAIVRSIRPILIDVAFEGNATIASDQLLSRIRTRPTSVSLLNRYANISADFSRDFARFLNSRAADRIDIRYLNMAVIHEDTASIRALYNENGFHHTLVGSRVELDTLRRLSRVIFRIEEGPRSSIWGVNVILPPAHLVDSQIVTGLETMTYLEVGEPMTVENVDLEARRMKAYLHENGYPFSEEFNLPKIVMAGPDVCPDSLYCDSVIFFIDPNTRYHIDTTVIAHQYDTISGVATPAVVDELILGRLRYKRGDLYKQSSIDETRRSLYRLGIFEQVAIDTTLVNEEEGLLGLRIRYTLRDENELEFALESSFAQRSEEVVWLGGVSGQYSRLNIGRRAIRGTVSGRVQARLVSIEELEWGSDVRFDIPEPNFLPILSLLPLDFDFFNVIGGYSRAVIDQERDARLRADRFLLGIELGITLPSYTMFNTIAGRITFQANNYYGVEEFIRVKAQSRVEELAGSIPSDCDTSVVVESVAGVLARNIYRIQVLQGDAQELLPGEDARASQGQLDETMTIGATLIGDHRDDFFQPSRGGYLELEGDLGATGFLDFKTGGFFRVELDARKFNAINLFGLNAVWANRIHAGGILQFGTFPLTPIASRFHAGGATSIRGWGPRELLVTNPPSELVDPCSAIVIEDILDESRRLLGGLALFEFSTEVRFKFGEFIVVDLFLDGGNAYFRNYSTDRDLLSFSTIIQNIALAGGAEIGYVTPAGPIRFGIGQPIIVPEGQSSTPTFHFSIGHAF